MVLTPTIIGAVVGTVSVLVIFAIAKACGGKFLENSKWGANLAKNPKCPKCGTSLPAVRIPKNKRQFMWGGWTCAGCGAELDKWLKEVPRKSAGASNGKNK